MTSDPVRSGAAASRRPAPALPGSFGVEFDPGLVIRARDAAPLSGEPARMRAWVRQAVAGGRRRTASAAPGGADGAAVSAVSTAVPAVPVDPVDPVDPAVPAGAAGVAPARRSAAQVVLLGGAPLRLMTLSAAGARVVARLRDGHTVAEAGAGAGPLARRLVDAGLAHPRPPRGARLVAAEVPDPPEDLLRVTVVIPVRDAADRVGALVTAILGAHTGAAVAGAAVAGAGVAGPGAAVPAPTGAAIGERGPAVLGTVVVAEVVVVDDGSRDGSGPVAAAAGARVIRHERPRGPAAARTSGARVARTAVIAFCDSDVRPSAGWLERLVAHLADPAVVAVAPRVASPPTASPPTASPPTAASPTAARAAARRSRDGRAAGGWLAAAGADLRARYEADRSPLDLGPRPGAVRPGTRISYVPSAALLVRREHVAFDPAMRFGEDVDLVWRLVAAGHAVRYEPAAVVFHEPRRSWWAWARQRFGYGSSAGPLARRHPGPLRPGRGVAAVVVGATVLAARRDLVSVLVAAGLAGGSAALTAVRLARRLPDLPWASRTVLGLTVRGRGHVVGAAAEAARRTWLPLLLTGRPGRLVLAAALVPLGHEWWVRRPAVGLVPYLVLRCADDAAYCAGVWWGVLRSASLEPLVPALPYVPGRRRGAGVPAV